MQRCKRSHFALAGLSALLLVGVLLLWLAACGRSSEPEDEFRIGFLGPLTGAAQPYAGHLWAERLVAGINVGGGLEVGGRRLKVRLLVEDTGSQMERALSAAVRLIRHKRVSALVGPYYSRQAIPVAIAAEAAQVPMVTPTGSNPQVTLGRSYVFRACLVDTGQGQVLARFAYQDLGLRRVGVLFDESDEYNRGLAGYFSDAFARLGGQVTQERYLAGDTDFSKALARIRSSGAEALFLPNYAQDVVRQMVQARAGGFRGLLLGGDSWEGNKAVVALPQAQGAIFFANFSSEQMDAGVRKEAERLQSEMGDSLDSDEALALDALGLILAAARAVGSVDPVTLRAGLASLRGYQGFTGQLSFSGGGDAVRSAHIMTITDGQARCRRELERGQ